MAAYKIQTIFIIFILVQNGLAKSVVDTSHSNESSEEEVRKFFSPSLKLFVYSFEHLLPLGQNFIKSTVNVSRHILQDESFVANTKADVVDFKKNLTIFVEKYDTSQGHINTQDILDIYSNITYYYELPEQKATPETTFILGILNKYNSEDVVQKFVKGFAAFADNFLKIFNENKAQLAKPILKWYEEYNTLTDFEQKFDAFSDFLEMAS